MTAKRSYTKPYKQPSDLIVLLKSRGLSFSDEAKAEKYLTNIGYYRLSAYSYPLLANPKSDHLFKDSSTFDDVMEIYRFDRKLRILLFNEIEKIEVAIRNILVEKVCDSTSDPFWITNPASYREQDKYNESKIQIDKELGRSKEEFIKHFRREYNDPYPPAWMLVEIISLGTLSKIFKNLKREGLKKKIAGTFGLKHDVFGSWVMQIANLRNICCHHGRLWNREFPHLPANPISPTHSWIDISIVNPKRTYYRICIIKYLLYTVSPHNTFTRKLTELISSYPTVDICAMGFPPDWKSESLWS